MRFQYLWLGALLALASAPAIGMDDDHASDEVEPDLLTMRITDLKAELDTGQWTAERVAQVALDRVASVDQAGPALRSLIHVNQQAVEQAAALAPAGRQGQLYGVPMVIGDRCDMRGLPTSGGIAALRGHQVRGDAFVVGRLRDAGAVVIGKANTDGPFSSYGRDGYSSAGGATRNPYRASRSGVGIGAAVASGFALGAVGSDTAGALRAAAAGSALVGIRPTLGLVSRSGTLPLARSLDTVGVLARSVHDAASMLGVIAGPDEADWRSREGEPHQLGDYTLFLDDGALADVRLGVAGDYCGGNPEVDDAFDAALAVLRIEGATLVDLDIPDLLLEAGDDLIRPIAVAELRDQLAAYLAAADDGLPDRLAELVTVARSPLITGSATPEDPARLGFWEQALGSTGVADLRYLYLISNRLPAARRVILDLLDGNDLDAIVYPTQRCPPAPLIDALEAGSRCRADDPRSPMYLASVTGFPEITVPMGYSSDGLPLGLSFLSRAYGESGLIAMTFAFEQATGHWRAPTLQTGEDDQASDAGLESALGRGP